MSKSAFSVLVQDLDACLPQTQCRECGYKGCLPYAEAMAQGQAPVSLCPPGGEKTRSALGALLKHPVVAEQLEPAREVKERAPAQALIREEECIGCTKCIQACPVDAILGSAKTMHVIIAKECTGCGLCVAPCPVDCIDLIALPEPGYEPLKAKARFEARNTRLLREKHRRQQNLRKVSQTTDQQSKRDYIQAALNRIQQKKIKSS